MTGARRLAFAAGLCTLLTFGVALLRFDGPARGYWDTYITAPALFMNQVPVTFTKHGKVLPASSLKGVLPEDLKDEATYGIITKDQRIGAGITASAPFAFLGIFGLRLLFALCVALTIPTTLLAARRLIPEARWAALVAALALAWNPFVLSVDRLNANLLVLPLLMLAWDLALRPKVPWVLLGLTLGLIAGLRNAAICFVPALSYWALCGVPARGLSERTARLLKLGGATVLAMLPIFYWKDFAFGSPFMHPSQYPHFQGFRPEFPHSLFGLHFGFNGLFNWPLHDRLVRTPHFAFPTYLLFPLVTLRALGLVGGALILLGLAQTLRRNRKVALFGLLWAGCVYLLFGPQENWEEVKMTFMLLAYPPLILWLAAGLHALTLRAGRLQRLVALAALCALLFAGVRWAATLDFPADTRWYVRFPKAAPGAPGVQAGLAETARNDTTFFLSHETPEEIARERHKLTAALPWPMPTLPLRWDLRRAAGELAAELGRRTLTVPDVWDDIYAQQPAP